VDTEDRLSSPLLFQLLLGFVNFLATVPAVFLVDRFGRVPLLRYSALGMAVSCFVLAVLGGACIDSSACSALALATTFVYVVSFEAGWGPVTWIYCSEIFPTRLRAKAMGLTTMSLWVGNFLVSFLPPMMIEAIGYNTFVIFGAFCVLCFLMAGCVPETRGRSLEEIAAKFERGTAGQGPPVAQMTIHLADTKRPGPHAAGRWCPGLFGVGKRRPLAAREFEPHAIPAAEMGHHDLGHIT
jgi:MFS family permease